MSEQLILNRWNDPVYIWELLKNKGLTRDFSRFSNCHPDTIRESLKLRVSTWELLLLERNWWIDNTAIFDAGYNMFQVPKSNGWFRTINEPAPVLKRAQWEIKDTLLWQIEIFSGAVWWERGKSFIDNARMHWANHPRYLVNLDLENAYPSVSPERLFVNLRESLRKKMDISFPQLTDNQKNDMIDVLVVLISHNNELPQWASTSMKALNIVMAQSDKKIMQFLHGEDTGLHSPLYTRYVDDLSVSWKEFSDMIDVWKIRTEWLKLLQWISTSSVSLNSDSINNYLDQLDSIVTSIDNLEFTINTRKQRSFIIQLLEEIRIILDSFNEYVHWNSQKELIEKLDGVKTKLRILRYSIEQSTIWNNIEAVAKWIEKILMQEWWKVNDSKTRIYTPGSQKQKVITGVSIDAQWRLGIPQAKEKEIQLFLERAIQFPGTLPRKYQWNPKLIAETIIWYKNYIIQVRWKINRDLSWLFRRCKEIYFPDGSDVARSIWYWGFTYNWE